jgi:exopolysaccharide production protein ExoZ
VRNIHSIQVLRAIAAIGVVLVHAGIDFNYWGHASINWHIRGAAGVDLFFVISGFVMVYISKPHFGQGDTWMTFILRRIIRIVPLYWLVTTFYAFSGGHPLHQIISSYLFIPDVEGAPPLLAQGWTLRYEMFFYLLFSMCLVFPLRMAVAIVCGMLVVLVLARVPFYGAPLVLEFSLGALVGWAYCEGLRMPRWMALGCMAVGFIAVIAQADHSEHFRLIEWGVPATLIVAGATLTKPLLQGAASGWASRIGDSSYALYLIHEPITRGVATAMRDGLHIMLASHAAAYLTLAIAAATFIAILLHDYIEAPIIAFLKTRYVRASATASLEHRQAT